MDRAEYGRVCHDQVGALTVDTAWIGIDRSPTLYAGPLIFETVAWWSGEVFHRQHYATVGEAIRGHESFVEILRNGHDPIGCMRCGLELELGVYCCPHCAFSAQGPTEAPTKLRCLRCLLEVEEGVTRCPHCAFLGWRKSDMTTPEA